MANVVSMCFAESHIFHGGYPPGPPQQQQPPPPHNDNNKLNGDVVSLATTSVPHSISTMATSIHTPPSPVRSSTQPPSPPPALMQQQHPSSDLDRTVDHFNGHYSDQKLT
ncbi:hypothetical protein CAPTEDRAFT_208262, partial [Capitella teleta]